MAMQEMHGGTGQSARLPGRWVGTIIYHIVSAIILLSISKLILFISNKLIPLSIVKLILHLVHVTILGRWASTIIYLTVSTIILPIVSEIILFISSKLILLIVVKLILTAKDGVGDEGASGGGRRGGRVLGVAGGCGG